MFVIQNIRCRILLALALLLPTQSVTARAGHVVYSWTGTINLNQTSEGDPWQIGEQGAPFRADFFVDASQFREPYQAGGGIVFFEWSHASISINGMPTVIEQEILAPPSLGFWEIESMDYSNPLMPTPNLADMIFEYSNVTLNNHTENLELQARMPVDVFDLTTTVVSPPTFPSMNYGDAFKYATTVRRYYIQSGKDGRLSALYVPEPHFATMFSAIVMLSSFVRRRML